MHARFFSDVGLVHHVMFVPIEAASSFSPYYFACLGFLSIGQSHRE